MTRKRMDDVRCGVTQRFTVYSKRVNADGTESEEVEKIKGYWTVGEYADGSLGEIFVRIGKAGNPQSWVDSWAKACSVALQHGAGVDELFSKFVVEDFAPHGQVRGVDGITSCRALTDLVSRWILARYGKGEA